MATWSEIEAEAPELAAVARGFFDADIHKSLATLRRDGSPRISGTEINFSLEGLWFGSMWGATKARDLQRDPRFAVHSHTSGTKWKGDAKIAGRAIEVSDPERKKALGGDKARDDPFHLFIAYITELAVVRIGEPADHLVIDAWHEGRGLSSTRR